jgi:hypothetical protein
MCHGMEREARGLSYRRVSSAGEGRCARARKGRLLSNLTGIDHRPLCPAFHEGENPGFVFGQRVHSEFPRFPLIVSGSKRLRQRERNEFTNKERVQAVEGGSGPIK